MKMFVSKACLKTVKLSRNCERDLSVLSLKYRSNNPGGDLLKGTSPDQPESFTSNDEEPNFYVQLISAVVKHDCIIIVSGGVLVQSTHCRPS